MNREYQADAYKRLHSTPETPPVRTIDTSAEPVEKSAKDRHVAEIAKLAGEMAEATVDRDLAMATLKRFVEWETADLTDTERAYALVSIVEQAHEALAALVSETKCTCPPETTRGPRHFPGCPMEEPK